MSSGDTKQLGGKQTSVADIGSGATKITVSAKFLSRLPSGTYPCSLWSEVWNITLDLFTIKATPLKHTDPFFSVIILML